MSTEAEDLLQALIKKIEGLEIKIKSIAKENVNLRRMIKLIYEQNQKLVIEREEKIRKEEGRESIEQEGERIIKEIKSKKG